MPIYETLASETGIDVTLYTGPGCAYLDLIAPMNVGKPLGCAEMWVSHRRRFCSGKHRRCLFLSSLRLRRFCDQWNVTPTPKSRLRLAAIKPWHKSLKPARSGGLVTAVFGEGASDLVRGAQADFQSPPFRCSDWFNSANPVCRGGSRSLGHILRPCGPYRFGDLGNIRPNPGRQNLDPLPVLCPTETCSAFRDGRPLYLDADHISAFGNSVLYPSFKHAIGAVPGHP